MQIKNNMNGSQNHRRRSIRLRNFDYSSAGAYFVTVCTKERVCLLGQITNGEMTLNQYGQVVKQWWNRLSERYDRIELDEFVIMPNHLHGIIMILSPSHDVEAIHESLLSGKRRGMLLSKCIGFFKMNAAKQINRLRKTPGYSVWQRNYYEHVIRNEDELDQIREYIIYNPFKWEEDKEHPQYNQK